MLTRTRHGLSHSRTWRIWVNMKTRCTNPNYRDFHRYGGRGIKIDPRWEADIAAFVADMGLAPDGLTLDRIDLDGGYCAANCRWATKEQQARNTRRNVFVEYDGRRMTVSELAQITGINRRTLEQRHHKGWTGAELVRPVSSR